MRAARVGTQRFRSPRQHSSHAPQRRRPRRAPPGRTLRRRSRGPEAELTAGKPEPPRIVDQAPCDRASSPRGGARDADGRHGCRTRALDDRSRPPATLVPRPTPLRRRATRTAQRDASSSASPSHSAQPSDPRQSSSHGTPRLHASQCQARVYPHIPSQALALWRRDGSHSHTRLTRPRNSGYRLS